jgi:DNA-directed RNA polymerase specialized sigma24 family protein
MTALRELPLPVIRDRDGRKLPDDEALSRWLLSGQATLIPPAYGDENYPLDATFADPFDPDRDLRLALIDELTAEERALILRHVIRRESFTEIAKGTGTSRQAVRQRYERIVSRLREAAAALADGMLSDGSYQ